MITLPNGLDSTIMSELFPKVTSDEVDHEQSIEDVKRDAEIAGDKPPHHDD